MTFRGTIANINSALNNMVYTPNVGFQGNDTLLITTNDLGNTGVGSALIDNDAVTIQVLPVSTDTFTRTDNATLGTGWTTQAGPVGISGNMALGGGAGVNVATMDNSSLADAYIAANVNVSARGPRPAWRDGAPATSTCTRTPLPTPAALSPPSSSAMSRAPGPRLPSSASLLGTNTAIGNSGALTFEVYGDALKLFWGTISLRSRSDSALSGPGLTGLRSGAGVDFRQFGFRARHSRADRDLDLHRQFLDQELRRSVQP